MAESKASSVFAAGSAVWREVISAPFERVRKRAASVQDEHPDPVNAMIEGEIIPRLLMAHSGDNAAARLQRLKRVDPEVAEHFATLPLRLDAAALLAEVDTLLAEGISFEAICLDLLAPSARKLGEMWEADECDFIDVTMGLWRLQEVTRDIAERAPTCPTAQAAPRTALFAPMPGDQHNFGTVLIDEIFARAGWKSEALVKPERRELLDRLARQPYDLVGLTLARDCPSAALSNLIKAMRNVSANPEIIVLVGGRAINTNPRLAVEAGADGTGADALAALELANALVTMPAARAMNLR
jgi:methanogenic corrinoid protein MtbC1